MREEAWRTDHNIVVVNLASGERKEISSANPAADGFPPRYYPATSPMRFSGRPLQWMCVLRPPSPTGTMTRLGIVCPAVK